MLAWSWDKSKVLSSNYDRKISFSEPLEFESLRKEIDKKNNKLKSPWSKSKDLSEPVPHKPIMVGLIKTYHGAEVWTGGGKPNDIWIGLDASAKTTPLPTQN